MENELITKTLKVFEYYNVPSGIDSIYGNWAVSKEADIINIE